MKTVVIVALFFALFAVASAQKCRINPGDWFIKKAEDRSGYFMFGEASSGVSTESLESFPFWFQYVYSAGELTLKYVARGCEGREDVFAIDWAADCSSFTLSPTEGTRTCADGLAGTYELFSVCVTSCRIRAGMALRALNNAYFAIGVGQVDGETFNFPVTVHDPATGVYWLEFRQTQSRESFELSTVAFLNTRGVLQNEDGAQICVSRGAYVVSFDAPCNSVSFKSVGDPCPTRQKVFNGLSLDVAWCSSLGFKGQDNDYSGTLLTSDAPSLHPATRFVLSSLYSVVSSLFMPIA